MLNGVTVLLKYLTDCSGGVSWSCVINFWGGGGSAHAPHGSATGRVAMHEANLLRTMVHSHQQLKKWKTSHLHITHLLVINPCCSLQ